MEEQQQITPIGYVLSIILLALLSIAGYISYQSIDFDVLKRMEEQELILPSPIPPQTQSSLQNNPTTKEGLPPTNSPNTTR